MNIKKVSATTATLLIIFGVVVSIVYFSNNYIDSDSAKNETVTNSKSTCDNTKSKKHEVQIQDDKVSPAHTDGTMCGTLTITNLDDKVREIAFGVHDSHIVYGGIKEKALAQGESLTVTLNKTGNYLFHDHDQDEVRGTFTVLRQ